MVGGRKSGGMEKIYLYKFTRILLLKNDVLLKQKQKMTKKKSDHPNILGIKNNIQKKKITSIPKNHKRKQKIKINK